MNMESGENECFILFDEMSIKRYTEYASDLDIVEGLQDLGHLGRANKLGTHALVFMVRGIIHTWKIPMAYYITAGPIKAPQLQELLLYIVEETFSIGYNIRGVVCDQGSNNQSTFINLGVTVERPLFYVADKKIYTLYDVPHLVKSVRNNLKDHNLLTEEKTISWEDIRALYDLDSQSTLVRANTKLSAQHVSPNNFEKMKVKLAMQIFSNRVAAALRTAIATKEITSPTAPYTAEFIQDFNHLIDTLNSTKLNNPNKYKCAISKQNIVVLETIKSGLEWVKTWNFPSARNVRCVKGLQQTIQGIISLWEDLEADEYLFLRTGML